VEIKKELLKREIAGESFLIPLGKTTYEANGLYALTELGGFIWDQLPQAESEEDILRAILAEYDVDEAIARADLTEFLNKLRAMNIL
jgi:hypothetical protein